MAMSSPLHLPELHFLSPHVTLKRRISLSKLPSSAYSFSRHAASNVTLRAARIRASRDDSALAERVDDVKWSGNGVPAANGRGRDVADGNGAVEGFANGASNGSLVTYGYENGNGVAAEVVVEVEASKLNEDERKKRLEEIGKEDAWFKQTGNEQVEVAVAPGGRWSRFKTYSTIQRTLEIWGFVATFIFKVWLNSQKFSYKGGMTEEKQTLRRKALAKWLKESILRLGPTFIKIGQQFSTRVDILPQEYVDQLSELQDQVPPFPSETSIAIVEEELGSPLGDIFDQFDYEPIAAASLGQVHRARLKGKEVAIKVQRPGLKGLFDIDLKNLRVIAEYLQKLDPKSDGAKRDWVAIYDECASVLYQEIDYTKEAANAELFASNFKNMDYVKVPTIYWDYTTPQILTMEYVPGIKINKIQALDQLGVDRKS
ncbi:hypothetical protein PHAVU_009G140366 [Phaseolus vulgaris]